MNLKPILLSAVFAVAALSVAGSGEAVSSLSVPATAKAGKTFWITVKMKIQPGYHVYSPASQSKYIITTAVKLKGPAGFKLGKPTFPVGKTVDLAGEKIVELEGDVAIKVPVTAPAGTAGKKTLAVAVSYQVCNDRVCLPAATDTLKGSVTIKK